jgi:Flp pilus assembly protein TadG
MSRAAENVHQSKRRLCGFFRHRRGAAAVEFALLAFPFFLIIASILEIGLVSLSGVMMQQGVREAARGALTGSGACRSREQLAGEICQGAAILPQCGSRLELKQVVFPSGWQNDIHQSAATAGSPGQQSDFSAPNGGDVVVVQATYRWSTISPIVSPFLGDGQGELEIRNSFAFQTEPYGTSTCP